MKQIGEIMLTLIGVSIVASYATVKLPISTDLEFSSFGVYLDTAVAGTGKKPDIIRKKP